MKATSEPSAPGRGRSSISRAPRAFNWTIAAAMSSTRRVMWCSPGPRFSHERRDRRIGRGRLEQLELRFPDRDEVRANALRGHLFGRFDLQAERVPVERERGLEILHRDADVIEDGLHDEFGTASSRTLSDLRRVTGLQTGARSSR